MKLGTRLLLPLLPTVTLIMVVYAAWAMADRENTLVPEARLETQAYTTALGLALDYALRDVRHEQVQEIINQVSRARTIYGIILYDSAGRRIITSDSLRAPGSAPDSILRGVIRTGRTATFEREIEDQRVYSVLRPVRDGRGRVAGALEVAQPLAFVEAEQVRVRRRFLFNTVSLLAALTVVTLYLVRRRIAEPIARVVQGARALGGGNLGYRIGEDPGGGELTVLARELNGMARSLEDARATAAREAEERVGLERRLRESEKLAAIGNLAAGLAHEIAAPLNVISGRAELLLRRAPPAADEERQLRIIVNQIGRINGTVQNLLGFAKRRDWRPQPLDFTAVLEDALEFLEGEWPRARVTVERDLVSPAPIMGDADQLHHLMVNVLLNAVQAMEPLEGDHRLRIRLRAFPAGVPLDPPINASAGMVTQPSAESRWILLEVEDTGPGIPPESLPRLFDPYYTTKARGTGLGLVIARSVVQEHSGWMDVRNAEPGPGAVFRIALPRRMEPT